MILKIQKSNQYLDFDDVKDFFMRYLFQDSTDFFVRALFNSL